MRTRVEPVANTKDRSEQKDHQSDDDYAPAFVKRAPRHLGVRLIVNWFLFINPRNPRLRLHHRKVSARPSAAARFKRAALCCASAVTCETRAFASVVCAVITSRL